MSTDVHVHVHIHQEPDGLTPRVEVLETQVGVIDEQILALNAKVEEYNEDVTARVQALEDAIAANDPVAIQAALDVLKATVDAGVAGVGDADGDGNPAPAPEPEPTP